jgi:hypothetical protein
MDRLREFDIGFLDTRGTLIKTVSIVAETATIAIRRAEAVAVEVGAADFYISAKSQSLKRTAHLSH